MSLENRDELLAALKPFHPSFEVEVKAAIANALTSQIAEVGQGKRAFKEEMTPEKISEIAEAAYEDGMAKLDRKSSTVMLQKWADKTVASVASFTGKAL